MTMGTAMAAMRTTTGRGRRSAASPSASRSISASCCWRSPPASSPPRWRCWPMPATTSPTCWAWSWPGSRSAWRAGCPAGGAPMASTAAPSWRRWPMPCCCWSRSAPSRWRASSGCWRRSRWRPASMLWVAVVGILVNGGTALLFARGREGRHQPPRRLPAHAGRCRRLGRRGGRGAADPGDRLAMGRSGARPRHRRGHPGWAPGDCCGNPPTWRWMPCRPGSTRPRCSAFLAAQPGVREVHDLHIWAMSTTETALTAHLVRPGAAAADDGFLAGAGRRPASALRHRPRHPAGGKRRPGSSLRAGPGRNAVTGGTTRPLPPRSARMAPVWGRPVWGQRRSNAMRALVWHGKQDIRCDTVPDPRIEQPRDAIIKVTSCAICGSDLHLYDGFMPGMKTGDIMGHESMGEVVEVGPDCNDAEGGRPRRRPLHHHLRRVRAVPARQLLGLRAVQPQQGHGRQGLRPHHRRPVRLHPPDRRLCRRPGRVRARALRRQDPHQGARTA